MIPNRPRPLALAALVAAACAGLAGWALAGRAQTPEPKGSTVYGRAVHEGSGRPVRRARVALMRFDELGTEKSVPTNGRGEFRLRGVAPGRYYIWVDAPGLISPVGMAFSGQAITPQAEEGAAKLFDVVEVDGEADKELTVRARLGGALGGRVAFADGEPAANVPIHIMRRSGGRHDRFMPSVSQAAVAGLRTDDRGRYRVAGLPPGEYVVGVAEPTQQEGGRALYGEESFATNMFESLTNEHLLLTFHPSASSAAEATAVTVAAGEEHEGVDITIPERELRTLSGVVRRRGDQRPAARAKVEISRRDSDLGLLRTSSYYDSAGNYTMTDAQGRWRLTEIPDGAYTLVVTPADEWAGGDPTENRNASVNMNSAVGVVRPARPRKVLAPAHKEIEVAGDAADLVVELSDGGSISGTVSIEGGKRPPSHVGIYAMRPSRSMEAELAAGGPHYASVRGAEFTIEAMPAGKFFLQANAVTRDEESFYVKAITWQGRDLLREPVEVGEGVRVEGVRVVLAADPSVLLVRARGPDERPALNVNVFLMPTSQERWSFSTPPIFCSTGGEGECEMKAAPGEYLVLTLPLLRSAGGVEQELRRRAAAAPRVSLRAGEKTSLDLAVKE